MLKDSLDQEILSSDVVMFPDGNPRFGGLYIRYGLITKTSASRLTLLTTSLDEEKPRIKTINKSPHKVTIIHDPFIKDKLKEILKDEQS